MSLELELIDDPRRWAQDREVWDQVVGESETPSIFSTWDFLEASWLRFAQPFGHRLAIVALRERGRAVGFVPLRLTEQRRLGLALRCLTELAGWEADNPMYSSR